MMESKFVPVERTVGGYLTHSNHYLEFANLKRVFYWDFGASVVGPDDRMPFHLGIVSVLAILSLVVGVASAKFGRCGSLPIIGTICAGLLAIAGTAMTTAWSDPLWRLLPILQKGQFPWRFLDLAAVGVTISLPAFCAGMSFQALRPLRRLVLNLALITVLASYLLYARSNGFTATFREDYKPSNWKQLMLTATEVDEFRPRWSEGRGPLQLASGTIGSVEGLEITEVQDLGVAVHFTAFNHSTNLLKATVGRNYFPGWRAEVEGSEQRLKIKPAPGSGSILIKLPPGLSKVRLTFGDTNLRRIWKLISGATALAMLGVLGLTLRGGKRRSRR